MAIWTIFLCPGPKKWDQKNDQKYGACTRCTVTVAKKSAYMTRVDPAMDNNCIVWLFGQYFCVRAPKNEIKKMTKNMAHVHVARWQLPRSQHIWPGSTRQWTITVLYGYLDNIFVSRTQKKRSKQLTKNMTHVHVARWPLSKSQRVWPRLTRQCSVNILNGDMGWFNVLWAKIPR